VQHPFTFDQLDAIAGPEPVGAGEGLGLAVLALDLSLAVEVEPGLPSLRSVVTAGGDRTDAEDDHAEQADPSQHLRARHRRPPSGPSSGSTMLARVPDDPEDHTLSSPPWARATRCTNARPRPRPP
jgi:hypothetical protein